MDAPEDSDLRVQKDSSELLKELLECIPLFLYRRSQPGHPARPRTAMTRAALSHLTRLLEMFQEWPQLLDPSLEALMAPLNDAFLLSLRNAQGQYATLHQQRQDKICFPQAVCMILYTMSKVRGTKVIVRFLSNEARYLEPILDALESWSLENQSKESIAASLAWEERYVFLLWLSHLLLTPFDLDTIGSHSKHDVDISIEGITISENMPLIGRRLLKIAIHNLSSASKAGESAALVLVRLALRPDMQYLALHDALIVWAVDQLQILQKSNKEAGYFFIGLLSFLAAIVKSADALIIGRFLLYIFNSVEQLGVLQSGSSSALTRKAVIKIYTACSVAAITLVRQPDHEFQLTGHVLELIIGELLSALADNDTPVRQAASKSLSVIATKLDLDMSADICEAIISNLEENVLWESAQPIKINVNFESGRPIGKQRNLTLVNASRWQGLVLTLAQLLFRRCSPLAQLPSILDILILALGFEQRSSTGVSLGTSVRDAACFGVWAIARRYSTKELLSIDLSAIPSAKDRAGVTNVIELLGIELLVASTTDPAGNIRRGASAALQELIGRHPDMLSEGIPLIQIVDYHAVALRSRAMIEVATAAARLDNRYWQAILTELTRWRGIGSADVGSRRYAAQALGGLASLYGTQSIKQVSQSLWHSLYALDGHTVQKRQGVLLGFASLVKVAGRISIEERRQIVEQYWTLFGPEQFVEDQELTSHTSRPELMSEAISALIAELSRSIIGPPQLLQPDLEVLTRCLRYVGYALDRNEAIVSQQAINAMKALFPILDPDQRQEWLKSALQKTKAQQTSLGSIRVSYLMALGAISASPVIDAMSKREILQHVIRIAEIDIDVDTRLVALQSLTTIVVHDQERKALDSAIVATINSALQDYTTDQRGDVGSILRLEAINTVTAAVNSGVLQITPQSTKLLELVVTLAGEKLDKVRLRAWACLNHCLLLQRRTGQAFPSYAEPEQQLEGLSVSHVTEHGMENTRAYFTRLIELFHYQDLRLPLLRGIVVSIGGGSESVSLASRTALVSWLSQQIPATLQVFADCLHQLLQDSLGNDRVLAPALETLALVLDSNIFAEESIDILSPRKLFNLVQKAHYKTSNMAKLLAAVEVYGQLAMVEDIRAAVIKKLANLLLHPFPRVRVSAADILFTTTREGSLKSTNWGDSTKFTKQALAIVKEALDVV